MLLPPMRWQVGISQNSIVHRAEEDLQALVKEKGSTFPNIIHSLAQYMSRFSPTLHDLTRVDFVLPANKSFYKTSSSLFATMLKVDCGTSTARSILFFESSSNMSVL